MENKTDIEKFTQMIKFMGYVKKSEVVKLFDNYNFESKNKLMKEIRKL